MMDVRDLNFLVDTFFLKTQCEVLKTRKHNEIGPGKSLQETHVSNQKVVESASATQQYSI
jgi:hypothetical protein